MPGEGGALSATANPALPRHPEPEGRTARARCGRRNTATRAADAFDLFILSDTTDPHTWIAEEAGFLALRERTGAAAQIFYRRRPKNTARKSGNIADWVRRFGGGYAQFLI